jgi:hypothetical protein
MRFPDPRISLEVRRERAEKAMAEENWEQAAKHWRIMLRRMGEQAQASIYMRLSLCYRKLGQADKSESVVKRGLNFHPRNSSLYIEHAEISMSEERWETAIKRWGIVCERFEDTIQPAVWVRFARALRYNSELAEAQKIINKTLKHYSENIDLLIESAEIETSLKDWKLALRKWEAVLAHPDTKGLGIRLRARLCTSVISRIISIPNYRKRISDYRIFIENTPPKIAIVTSFTKGYDNIKPHEFIDNRFDYIAYTDSNTDGFGIYDVRPLPGLGLDGARTIRYFKTHPHELTGNYDLVVWLDASIMIVGDLYPIFERFMKSGKAVGANVHPQRKTIHEEVDACIALKKEDPDVMKRQMAYYKKAGFNGNDIAECAFLTFNVKYFRKEVSAAMETWWDQICRFSRRDQLSFTYSLFAKGLSWYPLTKTPAGIRNHPSLILAPHKTDQPILDALIKLLK